MSLRNGGRGGVAYDPDKIIGGKPRPGDHEPDHEPGARRAPGGTDALE
jgi:hypothetical protein